LKNDLVGRALCIDLASSRKNVEYNQPVNPNEWFAQLQQKRLSIINLVPSDLYHLINPWYDRKYETVFGAREGESVREAAGTLLALMTVAVQSPEATKTMTEGLRSGDWSTTRPNTISGAYISIGIRWINHRI
jgi:hypothetical protein